MFVKILPPEVRSRISAGEVIESPSDVVKELVENSIDAGASRVEVDISKGGKRLIVVRDNGKGIHPEDIDKVILEGATSKIDNERDLMHLSSYGFRGEALHSIASVSRLVLRSRYFQEKEGYRIEVHGGELVTKSVVGMPPGTEVEVRDLFYNLPARRKFLKREDTERNRIQETLKEYALANPGVGFSLFSNGRELFSYMPEGELERVESVFGLRFEVVRGEAEFVRLRAYLSRNRRQGKFYIFLNSRPVSSRALKELFRKTLGYKTLGVVFIDILPFMVDFNVHPKKREIKFLKERKTLTLIKSLLSEGSTNFTDFVAQEFPAYNVKPQVIGQLQDTIILVVKGDFLYFLDQHLISERLHYERLGSPENAETISCKHAIKAGEKLSISEMEELVKVWEGLENPHVCPHGRPIYYRVHLKDIYEKLGRSY